MSDLKREDVVNVFNNERLAPRALAKALVIVYNNQTTDEQESKETKHHNSIGFSSPDANLGSRCATYFLKHKTLQPWMFNVWMKKNSKGVRRIEKYWRQLKNNK